MGPDAHQHEAVVKIDAKYMNILASRDLAAMRLSIATHAPHRRHNRVTTAAIKVPDVDPENRLYERGRLRLATAAASPGTDIEYAANRHTASKLCPASKSHTCHATPVAPGTTPGTAPAFRANGSRTQSACRCASLVSTAMNIDRC